jgi:hypothetical protein
VVTRNDDHGGDPLRRLQSFVNAFDAQCRLTGLDAELVVVEWYPPGDRRRLHDLVKVPAACPFALRFVEVPPELHGQLQHGDVLPLFQMIGKNVGIRRAKGRFVLATNIDIVFSNELVEYLARRELSAGRIYRVDRHDIEPDFPVDGPLEEQMEYCRTHQLRLHTRSGTQPVDSTGRTKLLAEDVVGSAGIVLGDGWHTREGEPGAGFFRWVKREARIAVDRTISAGLARGAVLDVEVEPNPYQPDSWVDVEFVDGDRPLGRRRVSQRIRLRFNLPDGIERHALALRLVDSSGGREQLPLYESRDELAYRVYHVSVHAAPRHEYDAAPDCGNHDNPEDTRTFAGYVIEARTDPEILLRRTVGPFESPSDGSTTFCWSEPIAGRFAFGAMDDDRQRWLPVGGVADIELEGIRAVGISLEARAAPGSRCLSPTISPTAALHVSSSGGCSAPSLVSS